MKNQEIKIKPISFSELLAGKVADGSKTMTRRLTEIGLDGNRYDVAEWVVDARFGDYVRLCTKDASGKVIAAAPIKPKFEVGQLLYGREPHWAYGKWIPNGKTPKGRNKYAFEYCDDFPVLFEKPSEVVPDSAVNILGYYKRLARFMPKKYARTFLRVTEVRCERLCDISGEDAIAEGVDFDENGNFLNYEHLGTPVYPFVNDYRGAKGSFLTLWNKINGANSCFANPWVWVVSFEKVEMPNPWNSQTVKP